MMLSYSINRLGNKTKECNVDENEARSVEPSTRLNCSSQTCHLRKCVCKIKYKLQHVLFRKEPL